MIMLGLNGLVGSLRSWGERLRSLWIQQLEQRWVELTESERRELEMAGTEIGGEVVKGGETRIWIGLNRTPQGLKVQVRARPDVEEFIRELAQGETVPITDGRYWVPIDQDHPLQAYAMPPIDGRLYTNEGLPINLNRLGCQLLEPAPEKGGEAINISFLRLVGIGSEEGVTFKVRGVYSFQMLRRMNNLLTSAATRFYIDYIRPVDLTGSLVVDQGKASATMQELRL